MKGPIKTITISNENIPVRHEATLTITIPLDSFDGPIDSKIGQMLENVLNDWRDGRYPFDVEMFKNGLHHCIKHAVSLCIEEEMHHKFGNEMVVSDDGRGSTARWYLESQKASKPIPYMNEPIKAEITHGPKRS